MVKKAQKGDAEKLRIKNQELLRQSASRCHNISAFFVNKNNNPLEKVDQQQIDTSPKLVNSDINKIDEKKINGEFFDRNVANDENQNKEEERLILIEGEDSFLQSEKELFTESSNSKSQERNLKEPFAEVEKFAKNLATITPGKKNFMSLAKK